MNSILSINHTASLIGNAGSQSISELSPMEPSERTGSEKSTPAAASPSPTPRMDEYLPGKESDAPGLYRIIPDEDGLRSIAFDSISQTGINRTGEGTHSGPAGGDDEISGEMNREIRENGKKAALDAPDAPKDPDAEQPEEETCITDTDKVDAEIRRLREKLEKLQQQLSGAGNQPQEQRRLEQQIAQVQQELQAKDTDSYRRQQAEH